MIFDDVRAIRRFAQFVQFRANLQWGPIENSASSGHKKTVRMTENLKLRFGTPVPHFVNADWCSWPIRARNSCRTAKKLIIGRFRTMRSINLTGFANAVLTHGMVIAHVECGTE